jgi:hypothetical protein
MLLVNYRPEYQHAWSSKTSYSQMRLDALLGDDPGLAPLKQRLIKRGEPVLPGSCGPSRLQGEDSS